MADKRKGFEEEKVFHQLIACLVGLGYQVHHYLIDAWTYGSPQQRSRIFISIAAPGLEPIAKPFMTHSHPSSINRRSLGTLVNGESFGCREEYATPFEYVTAGQATSDLPKIGSGLVQACTSFPDHRILRNMNGKDRALTRCIPVSPPGQGYLDALKLCRIPDSLLKTKQNPGRAFTRIKEASLFPTITTTVSPQDSRWGHVLHWNEHRPISLMEARRAQGIPDHEVIVGSLTEQWRIIGNAVERNVALALGLSLRRAWEASSGGSAQVQVNGEFLAKQEFKDTVEVIDLCSDNEYTPLDSDIIMSDAVINAKDSALDDAYPTGTRASPVLIPSPTRSPSPHISKMRPRKNPQADQRSGAVGKKRKRQSRLLTFAEFMPERWDTVPENYLKGVI
jgi:site-specific DNA-cytosine methylase